MGERLPVARGKVRRLLRTIQHIEGLISTASSNFRNDAYDKPRSDDAGAVGGQWRLADALALCLEARDEFAPLPPERRRSTDAR